jgi:hypothetical protein
MLVFVSARLLLAPRFPVTHALVDDWYNHAASVFAFLLGFAYARSQGARLASERLRWTALGLWLLGYAAYASYVWSYRADGAQPPDALIRVMRIVFALQQWTAIIAVLGFASRHVRRGGPLLAYLTVGVFPFYLVHQTIIVVAGHHLAALDLPLAVEAALLLAATALACVAAYELARRSGPLGVWFGVGAKHRRRPSATGAPAPSASG